MDPNAIPPADPPAMGTVGNTNLNETPDVKANMPESQDAGGTLVGMKPSSPAMSDSPTKSADDELAAAASLSQGVTPTPAPAKDPMPAVTEPAPSPMPATPEPAATPEPMPASPTLTPPSPATNPNAAMTTATGGKSKFGLFMGLGVAIVVFIWVGVGFLYYSNMTLEQEINANVSAQASSN